MYNNTKPLTQKQSDFAGEHHALVFDFLIRNGYSVDDYYDIAVFGYLYAVRMYDEYVEFQEDSFRDLAFRYMKSAVVNHFRAEKKKTADAVIIPIDDLRSARSIEDEILALVA